MALPLDDILSFDRQEGKTVNKYEVTSVIIKYARHLAQANDDMLEIPVGRNKTDKLTLVAMRDVLQGKVGYEIESVDDEK